MFLGHPPRPRATYEVPHHLGALRTAPNHAVCTVNNILTLPSSPRSRHAYSPSCSLLYPLPPRPTPPRHCQLCGWQLHAFLLTMYNDRFRTWYSRRPPRTSLHFAAAIPLLLLCPLCQAAPSSSIGAATSSPLAQHHPFPWTIAASLLPLSPASFTSRATPQLIEYSLYVPLIIFIHFSLQTSRLTAVSCC